MLYRIRRISAWLLSASVSISSGFLKMHTISSKMDTYADSERKLSVPFTSLPGCTYTERFSWKKNTPASLPSRSAPSSSFFSLFSVFSFSCFRFIMYILFFLFNFLFSLFPFYHFLFIFCFYDLRKYINISHFYISIVNFLYTIIWICFS
jgi:hypothetical protein